MDCLFEFSVAVIGSHSYAVRGSVVVDKYSRE